jgi:RHS repeat-associated protein
MLVRLLFIWMFLISAQVLASAEGMYIHTDGLGSPVARSDKNGNLISGSRTRYEPYGATAAGATPTIGFTGHVNDPATGLIYMQQRYYDPYAGRFLSTDPVLTDVNTGSAFNRYIYANNNPYKYVDPDGRQIALSPQLAVPIVILVAYKISQDPVAAAIGNRIVEAVSSFVPGQTTTAPLLNSGGSQNNSNNANGSRGNSGGASGMPPDDDGNKQRRDTSRDNNRKTESGEQPASDKQGKKMGNQIGKDLGKDAKQEFHNMKEKGAPDRTLDQLKSDAADLYQQAGKEVPKWTQ